MVGIASKLAGGVAPATGKGPTLPRAHTRTGGKARPSLPPQAATSLMAACVVPSLKSGPRPRLAPETADPIYMCRDGTGPRQPACARERPSIVTAARHTRGRPLPVRLRLDRVPSLRENLTNITCRSDRLQTRGMSRAVPLSGLVRSCRRALRTRLEGRARRHRDRAGSPRLPESARRLRLGRTATRHAAG